MDIFRKNRGQACRFPPFIDNAFGIGYLSFVDFFSKIEKSSRPDPDVPEPVIGTWAFHPIIRKPKLRNSPQYLKSRETLCAEPPMPLP